MENNMRITLTINYPNGDEYEVDAECSGLAGVPDVVQAEIDKIIHQEAYSSLVIVVVPK